MTDDRQAVEVALRQVEGLLAEGKRCSAQGGLDGGAVDPVIFKDGELVAFDCDDHSTGVAPYEAQNSREDGRPWVGFTVYLLEGEECTTCPLSGPIGFDVEVAVLRRATERESRLWRESHLAAMEDQWAGE